MARFALRLLPRPPEIGSDRAIQALIASLPRGEPSGLARAASRVGIFAVPVTVLALILVRSGRVELAAGLVAVAAGLLLALAAVVAGVAALIQIWRRGSYGADHAFVGIVLGLLVLALPIASAFLVLDLPAIYDISTDPEYPPVFTGAAAERASFENPAAYPGKQTADLQADAYPEIEALKIDYPPEDVYAAATALVGDWGWTVLDPGSAPAEGGSAQIEARSQSLILGFPQDIVIRIRPEGDGSRIDMRSASRIGHHDLGWNARRIGAFLRELALKASGRSDDDE